jgi:hypothetical protein
MSEGLRSTPRRSCVTSTPQGFAVYNPYGKHVQTIPFGQGQKAFDLANKLDRKAGVAWAT